MRRRSSGAVWGLILVWGLGLVAPAWAASWRDRPNAGDFAERIAGVYLIRHQTDDGRPGSFRLITLTPWGTWGSTNSNQHDSLRPFRFSDQHGVWERTGWREITAEVVDFNLDGVTGAHTDIVRVRYVVRFSKDLQSITGTQLGRVFPVSHDQDHDQEHDQDRAHDPDSGHDQDPLDPDAVPSAQFSSTFTGQRITVGPESLLVPPHAAGIIGATAMQYPLRMAALGVEAVVEFARSGTKPAYQAGAAFLNTGATLVTDEPAPGIPSISTAHGLQECWG